MRPDVQDEIQTLDTCAEALCLLEGSALLVRRAFWSLLATTLRDALDCDPRQPTGLEVVLAVEAAIASEQLGGRAEHLSMLLQGRCDVVLIRGIPVEHLVVCDQTQRALDKQQRNCLAGC